MTKLKPLTKVKKKKQPKQKETAQIIPTQKGIPFKNLLYQEAPYTTIAGSILQLPATLRAILENTVANYIKIGADEIKIKADNNNIVVVLKDLVHANKNKSHLHIQMNKETVFNKFI